MIVIDPDHIDCRHVVEIVTDYMEGALGESDRTGFEQHLLICPPCEGYYQQMQKTVGLVRGTGRAAPSATAKDALLTAFRRRQGKPG